MVACREGNYDIVKHYKDSYTHYKRFDVNAKNLDGWSAVMFAAFNGHNTIAIYLIKELDAEKNCVDRNGRSMLHWACRFGFEGVITTLLKLDLNYTL